MTMTTRNWIGAGIAVGAGALLAATATAVAVASAQETPAPTPAASSTASGDTTEGHGPGETLLTGSDAEKATAAAKAAVPDGTVLRVETDSDGVYEAHVRKSDGTEVVVAMAKNFTVTGVETFTGHGGGRHGGGSDRSTPSATPTT